MKALILAALLSVTAIIFATVSDRSIQSAAPRFEASPKPPLGSVVLKGEMDSACISQIQGADGAFLPCVGEISPVLGAGGLARQGAVPVDNGSLDPFRLSKDGGPPMDPDDPYTWPPYEDSVGPVNDSGPPMDPDDPTTWPLYEDSVGPVNDSGPPMDPDDPLTWPEYMNSRGPVNDSGPPMDPDDPLTWPPYPDA